MKAVVVEIHKNIAAVLSADGCIQHIKNNTYQIGQEVEMNTKKQTNFKKRIALASIAASILLLFGIGSYTYFTPYTYVSFDVNPSIEYSLNRFDKVLSVNGVNDDGTEILSKINLTNLLHKNIEDAISITVDQISEAGYFDGNESGLIITTSSKDQVAATILAQNLETVANHGLTKNNREATVFVEAVGMNRVEEAHKQGVTPGKLNLVEKLLQSAGNSEMVNKEEWLHKSVKEILAQINNYKEQEKNMGNDKQNQEKNQNIEEHETPQLPQNTNGNTMEEKNKDNIDSNSGPGNGGNNQTDGEKQSNPGTHGRGN